MRLQWRISAAAAVTGLLLFIYFLPMAISPALWALAMTALAAVAYLTGALGEIWWLNRQADVIVRIVANTTQFQKALDGARQEALRFTEQGGMR